MTKKGKKNAKTFSDPDSKFTKFTSSQSHFERFSGFGSGFFDSEGEKQGDFILKL